jgi:hypothetical protein
MERSQECPSWDKLFDQAVMELRPKAEGDGIDGAIQEIARAGMALYVERTGVQSVAGQKENQLLSALAHFDLVRQGGLEW